MTDNGCINPIKQKITPHLKKLIEGGSAPIEIQFKRSLKIKNTKSLFTDADPLGEETLYSPVRGIVHKFSNRILWKVSYRCAAHCQFCTRARQIGTAEGDLSEEDIENGLMFVREHPKIEEVILSGGDPFFTPKNTLLILKGIADIESVKVIRIGTRLPIHSPSSFKTVAMQRILEEIKLISRKKPFFIIIHVNHKDEIDNKEVHEAIEILKNTGAILMSQSVFLKGVNDEIYILSDLFKTLYYMGILPYYIYRCDQVRGLERFICSIEKEQYIMTELRRHLSGLAIPLYIIDVPGRGKIPVPLGFWNEINLKECIDFDGKKIIIP